MEFAAALFPPPVDPADNPYATWMAWIGGAEASFNPDQPVAGFYRRRADRIAMTKLDDGTEVRHTFPVMIWHGEDADFSTGEIIPAGWVIQWGGSVGADGAVSPDKGRRARERIKAPREGDAVYSFFQNQWGQMEAVPYDVFCEALKSGLWPDGVRTAPPSDQERAAATIRANQAKEAAEIQKRQRADEKEAERVAAKASKEADKAVAGHNNPPPLPETYGGMVEVIEETLANARTLVKVETQTQAENVVVVRERLNQLVKGFDAMRVTEKKPHDEAAAAVQERYIGHINKMNVAIKTIREAAETFIKRQRALAAAAAPAEAGEAAPAAPARIENAGGGRAASMAKVRVADITDAGAFAAWLVKTGNPDMTALLAKVALRMATANADAAPGITIRTEERLR